MTSKKRIAMVCGKRCEAPIGDYFVTCSFDPNHVILRSRMPYHIIKCIKNHPGHNKIQCPYDATEYIDNDMYEDHILNCESRRSVADADYEIAYMKANGLCCNIRPTPTHPPRAPEPPVGEHEEDWGGAAKVLSDDFVGYNFDETDYNEDLSFDPSRAVGRGIRSRNTKPTPRRGVGRGEMLKRIFENYQKTQVANSSTGSSSNQSVVTLIQDISEGQFEDK